MNLSTVSNHQYFISSINLIESYLKQIPAGNINYYYFDMPEDNLTLLKNIYPDKIKLIEVEKVVEHAHDPKMFFYKAWSLLHSIKNNDNFLYLDAGSEIVGDLSELQLWLQHHTRVFIRQHIRERINIHWTTKVCFEVMGMNEERYYFSPQYHANLQAYIKTEENIEFVNKMYNYMLNTQIAGPSAKISYPETNNPLCKAHRSDQSVLSILIEHYNWHQKRDFEIEDKYSLPYRHPKSQVICCHRFLNRTGQIRLRVLSKILSSRIRKDRFTTILKLLPIINSLHRRPTRNYYILHKLVQRILLTLSRI